MIDIKNITYKIKDKNLLEDITLTLHRGNFYGLIGHNGSGKSTLMRLLNGELSPTQGIIHVNQQALDQLKHKERAKLIAYLPQNLPAHSEFSVRDLVMLGRYAWQNWWQKPSDLDKEIVEDALKSTHLERLADKNIYFLSGGERQRAYLAMCLAQQSPYLLLDEPLSALDVVYQIETLQLLQKLVQEKNLLILMIIHDINLAARYCDQLIALRQGALCKMGNIAEMMNEEALKTIFNVAWQIIDHPNGKHKVAIL